MSDNVPARGLLIGFLGGGSLFILAYLSALVGDWRPFLFGIVSAALGGAWWAFKKRQLSSTTVALPKSPDDVAASTAKRVPVVAALPTLCKKLLREARLIGHHNVAFNTKDNIVMYVEHAGDEWAICAWGTGRLAELYFGEYGGVQAVAYRVSTQHADIDFSEVWLEVIVSVDGVYTINSAEKAAWESCNAWSPTDKSAIEELTNVAARAVRIGTVSQFRVPL